MAASTPMSDDWEMVFIDEDGEVVSGKAPVPQSRQEVPIEIDILIKEMQLAKKEQKESTEKEPAKPIQIRRPVPDCYRPTYAIKGSYLPANHFDKQDAPDGLSNLFGTSWKVVESAGKTASKVYQERAKYSQESKTRTAKKLKDYENSLTRMPKACSAEIAGPSRPGCGLQRPCQMTPFLGMEQGESSRSGAEPNNPEFPPLRPMMPQPPRVKPETESRKQHVAALDQTKIQMEQYQMQKKMMPRPDGSISQGSVTSSSLERKFSSIYSRAIVVFLWEGEEGSDSNAMGRAKSKLEQKFSGWDITFKDESSFSSEYRKEVLRRHNVRADVTVTDFVHIGFVSDVDYKLALEILESVVLEGRGPRMAVRG